MPATPDATLSPRALNRATLARQSLLDRDTMPIVDAVERFGGVQAQLARPPFVALWTRLAAFTRDALLDAVHARSVVRATLMRGTLHLVSAGDYWRLRPALEPMLAAAMRAVLRDRAAGLDTEATVSAARVPLAERPHTFEELRGALARRFPDVDERALGYAVRMLLPLVQVPTSGAPWGWDTGPAFALAESWAAAPTTAVASDGADADEPARRALVRRYLGAFGPATAADMMVWSGVRSMRPTFDAMRDELVTFRDRKGRELFDMPHAPRPGEDADAPVRFLPEFDSLVLAHDDRSRVVPDLYRPRIVSRNLQVAATVLVDGVVAGTWKVARSRGVATLTMTPYSTVPRGARPALALEGEALARFVEPDAKAHEFRLASVEAGT